MRQSTNFAITRVTAITLPAIRALCQNCDTGGLFAPVDRFPPGVALFEPVPGRDRLFPDVPAEQHLFAFAHRREVEQAEVEVLQDDAQLLELVDARERHVREAAELRLSLVQIGRRITAAVPADRN